MAADRRRFRTHFLKKTFTSLALLLSAATTLAATTIEQFHMHDFAFKSAATGNPFDVDLTGEFVGPDGARLKVPGFYDGDGV